MSKQRLVKVRPQNIEITAQAGDNLYRVLAEYGVLVDGDCGGRGTCRRCRVRVLGTNQLAIKDQERTVFSDEQLREGWRLACLQEIYEPLTVEIPTTNETELQVAVGQDIGDSKLALAVDVGTTSVAAGLVDIKSGTILGTATRANSQRSHGADIITRLGFALERPDGTEQLQRLVWQDIAALLDQLCMAVKADKTSLTTITLAANSTMAHFLWGISPRTLAAAPYEPVFVHGQQHLLSNSPVADLFPTVSATVYLLPNIAGFLGSDTVAAAYACELAKYQDDQQFTLLLDIGTNGEMVLAGQGQLLAASAAAGPAFEGAHLSCGMRGTTGALHTARLADGDVICETIDNMPLAGICGSGLLSLISLLRREQVLDKSGRFNEQSDSPLTKRLTGEKKHKRFILTDQVYLLQDDVRQFQLAKGAIAACWQSILAAAHAEQLELGQVLLAGVFGSKLDIADAILVGMLPDLDKKNIHHVGNAAWQGVYLASLSSQYRDEMEKLARSITYLNTGGSADFSDLFIKALML